MPDLSVIKNEKLRDLIKASAKFNALSEFQQQKHLQGMQNVSPEKEEKLCQFFTEENAKEDSTMSNEERLAILNRLFDELGELESKFTRLLKNEPEKQERKKNDEDMDNLLGALNS